MITSQTSILWMSFRWIGDDRKDKGTLVEAALRADDAETLAFLLSLYNEVVLDQLDGYIVASSSHLQLLPLC